MTSTTSASRAVVTGASSGIGAATVRRLRDEGWAVVAVARRADRLAALAEQTGAEAFAADLTVQADVDRLAAHLAATGGLTSLVNNAGGAFGLEPVAQADPDDWQRMYDINVLGTLRITKALLPQLIASGRGDIVVVTSTAALGPYENGAGYTGVKHAERMLTTTLRLELIGQPVRVIDVAPGAVATEEFALNRFDGDAERAAQVYAGYQPLVADDIADVIAFALTRPQHVNIDTLVVRPRAQVSNTQTAKN